MLRSSRMLGVYIVCISIILACFLETAIYSQAPSIDQMLVQRLADKDPNNRVSAMSEMLTKRNATIQSLISVVNTEKDIGDNSSLYISIVVLGEYRATEAIPQLINHLLYIPNDFKNANEAMRTEDYYISAVSLVKIGEPSIRPLLRKIAISDNADERNIATWIIMEIEGKSQASYRIGQALEYEKDDGIKKRYAESVEYIKLYKIKFAPPGIDSVQSLLKK